MTAETRTTRKRPAPGASPLGQTQLQNSSSTDYPTFQDQGPATSTYPDPSSYATHSPKPFGPMPVGNKQARHGNQLQRRPYQPVVPVQNYTSAGNGAWQPGNADGQLTNDEGWGARPAFDDLDQKAAIAKKDAESRRKQIPPFVQKLSRYGCCLGGSRKVLLTSITAFWTSLETPISSVGRRVEIPSSFSTKMNSPKP